MSPIWILKRLVLVFINACCLLSDLLSLLQFGRGKLSLVAISFSRCHYFLGHVALSEFTLAGPQMRKWAFTRTEKFSVHSKNTSPRGYCVLCLPYVGDVGLWRVWFARSLQKIICSVGWVTGIEIREFGSRIGNNFPGNWSIGWRF